MYCSNSIILQSLVREADPRTAPAQFRVERGERHIKSRRHVFDRFALLPKLLERLPGLERCESVARH